MSNSQTPPSFQPRRKSVINSSGTGTSGAGVGSGARSGSGATRSTGAVGGSAEHLPPAYLPRSRGTAGGNPPAFAPASQQQPGQPEITKLSQSEFNQKLAESRAAAAASTSSAKPRPQKREKLAKRIFLGVLVLILIVVICWPFYLIQRANSQLGRVDALSGATNSAGTTYLFVGSDSREGYSDTSSVSGQRSDSIILIHQAENGQTAMVSLPRDTYVEIPGYGMNKINASFSYGGASLLVETVENLTGLTVDHYIQIGMSGVGEIVDSLGGVELCLDYDVDDEKSGLVWEAGCHVSDGETALAFSRMRYSDPLGDIGRGERQRQVLNAVSSGALSWELLINPVKQVQLVDAGSNALTVDEEASVLDVAKMLLALREATTAGLSGTPPIASMGYATSAGSAVLLDESTVDDFFSRLRSGTLTEADFESTLG